MGPRVRKDDDGLFVFVFVTVPASFKPAVMFISVIPAQAGIQNHNAGTDALLCAWLRGRWQSVERAPRLQVAEDLCARRLGWFIGKGSDPISGITRRCWNNASDPKRGQTPPSPPSPVMKRRISSARLATSKCR